MKTACSFFLFTFLFSTALRSQTTAEKVQTYRDILHSKDQMMSSVSLGISPANFISKDYRTDSWKSVQYNSQWFQFSYGVGSIRMQDQFAAFDTVSLKEFTLGGTFSIKKLALGKRLYDIRGAMMLPVVSAAIGQRTAGASKSLIGKISPGVSFQLPYFGIDFRLHSSFRLSGSILGMKSFAITPEIAFKFDGLYNLLDARRVYIGHAEGTQTFKTTSYSQTTERDGDYLITTTYRTETTTVAPYSIDRNATLIGPLAAIGPHISFSSHPYAGNTRMYGLGYYLRLGILSSDFLFDTGKIGFASSMEETVSVDNPSPKPLSPVNKEDYSNPGYYNANRFQARIGIDLYEIYMSTFGADVAVGRNQTKFSRLIGGVGYGFATVSSPHYNRHDGQAIADERFKNDYTLFTTSGNSARFAKAGSYLSFYFSVEAGAIRLTFESNSYFNAALANVKSVSVGYMFPYNRIRKKMKAIRMYQNYIRENG